MGSVGDSIYPDYRRMSSNNPLNYGVTDYVSSHNTPTSLHLQNMTTQLQPHLSYEPLHSYSTSQYIPCTHTASTHISDLSINATQPSITSHAQISSQSVDFHPSQYSTTQFQRTSHHPLHAIKTSSPHKYMPHASLPYQIPFSQHYESTNQSGSRQLAQSQSRAHSSSDVSSNNSAISATHQFTSVQSRFNQQTFNLPICTSAAHPLSDRSSTLPALGQATRSTLIPNHSQLIQNQSSLSVLNESYPITSHSQQNSNQSHHIVSESHHMSGQSQYIPNQPLHSLSQSHHISSQSNHLPSQHVTRQSQSVIKQSHQMFNYSKQAVTQQSLHLTSYQSNQQQQQHHYQQQNQQQLQHYQTSQHVNYTQPSRNAYFLSYKPVHLATVASYTQHRKQPYSLQTQLPQLITSLTSSPLSSPSLFHQAPSLLPRSSLSSQACSPTSARRGVHSHTNVQNSSQTAHSSSSSQLQRLNPVYPPPPRYQPLRPEIYYQSSQSPGYLFSVLSNKEKEKYLHEFNFPFCDDATVKYEKVGKIGQGTFGEVFKAREKNNPAKVVAMKKILMENEKEGFPITALREIRILQLLKHENVVHLIEICRTKATVQERFKSTFYLVFDFCEHDLAGLLSNMTVKFSLGEIKKVMQQMFNGLYFIHYNKIIHRDMKAANVLITKDGILKLADFGLARAFSQNKNGVPNRFTNRVVTLWYRPPELLLGDRNYGPPVDMWGAGCIMAELWTRTPIMQGNTEQQQLALICQLCGSITAENWPGVKSLELYNKFDLPKAHKRKVKERLKHYVKDPYGCDLLDKLLTLDPDQRIDSDSALNHDFFWTDPMPMDLSKMLAQHSQNMFEYLAAPKKTTQSKLSAVPIQPVRPAVVDDGFQNRIF